MSSNSTVRSLKGVKRGRARHREIERSKHGERRRGVRWRDRWRERDKGREERDRRMDGRREERERRKDVGRGETKRLRMNSNYSVRSLEIVK